MDQTQQDIEQLQALVSTKGALKIITAAHDHPAENPAAPDPDQCAESEYGLDHPKHYVLHDAVKVEQFDENGVWAAHSEEGDITIGYPTDLLNRLMEHRK